MPRLTNDYTNNRNFITLSIILNLIICSLLFVHILESTTHSFDVQGSIYIVDEAGNGNYTTIQSALDNATPGDTIYVWEGEYHENVIINKTITLIGNGSSVTTINGSWVGDVVRITAQWVNVMGFNIIYSGRKLADSGLEVSNGEYANISNNSFDRNLYSIKLLGEDNCVIRDNEFYNSTYESLEMDHSFNNNVINNTFLNNSIGIISWYGGDNDFRSNTVKGSSEGIWVKGEIGTVVKENSLSDNDVGIVIWDCTGMVLLKNKMTRCGLFLFGNQAQHWDTHDIDTTNLVNDNPLYYWENRNGGTIPEGAGQVILAECSNIRVENQQFGNGSIGITLGYSNDCIIESNKFDGCFIPENQGVIWLRESIGTTISKNILVNNSNGIFITEGSDNNIISNNTVEKCEVGIRVDCSDSNQITDNVLRDNTDAGLVLAWSDITNIHDNIIQDNIEDGIEIHRSDMNVIYHNNIINNFISIDNLDETVDWYFKGEGNYWNYYNGLDTGASGRIKGDHIGDSKFPYRDTDPYPYIRPWGWRYPFTPLLSAPMWTVDDPYNISWNQTNRSSHFLLEQDISPSFSNPTTIYDGWEEGNEIVVQVNGQSLGTYYYRIKGTNDDYNGDWSDSIEISVYSYPTIPTNLLAEPFPEGNALKISWDLYVDETIQHELQCRNSSSWDTLVMIEHPGHSYDHTGLSNGETYSYRVRAIDIRDVHSSFSSTIDGIPNDTMPPSPPTNVFTSHANKTSLTLSWDGSPEEDVVGYLIYRSISKENGFVKINNSTFSGYKFIDNTLDDNTTYYFMVTALDEVPLESDFSNIVSGATTRARHVLITESTTSEIEIIEDTVDEDSINLYEWFSDIKGNPISFRSEDSEHVNTYIYGENGTVILTPEKNWNGEEEITFFASDGVHEVKWKINITVVGINDPPGIPIIEEPSQDTVYEEGDVISFSAYCTDPDIPYGDILEYQWTSNISGDFGGGVSLNRVELPPGDHMITLRVSDIEGETSETTVYISIIADSIPNPNDNISDGNHTGKPTNGGTVEANVILIISFIIATVVFGLMTIFLYFRKLSKQIQEKNVDTSSNRVEALSADMKESSFEENKDGLRKWTPKTMIKSKEEALKILGLEACATPNDIRDKYRKLAKENHPDTRSEMEVADREAAEKRMKQLNEAYQFLAQSEIEFKSTTVETPTFTSANTEPRIK